MEIIQDFITKGSVNRSGAENSCKYITIHDTANTEVGANAKAHAKYIKTLKNRTSWHYTVDDSGIYQHLPDNEKSYHTSSAKANESSIAVELCINADGDFEKTVDNAVWLVHHLMEKHGIPASNVMSHKDWTGKNCPKKLLAEGWSEFATRCARVEDKKRYITVDELIKLGYAGVVW